MTFITPPGPAEGQVIRTGFRIAGVQTTFVTNVLA